MQRTGRPAQPLYSVAWFEALFDALDRLHDDVSTGALDAPAALPLSAMTGWLEDIVYTAQETIAEIRAHAPAADGTSSELIG